MLIETIIYCNDRPELNVNSIICMQAGTYKLNEWAAYQFAKFY